MISELLEDYKDADELEKQEIINEFLNRLWKSKYTYKTFKKYYRYKVNSSALNDRGDLIELFTKYKDIEFTFCKSFYNANLSSVDYIRIHINNMYGYLTDKNVYLSREYYQLLLTPKKLYYYTIEQIKQGNEIDYDNIKYKIKYALNKAEEIKQQSQYRKIDIKWSQFKKLTNTYIERLFNNYIPPHEYEELHGWEMNVNIDSWTEDNYVVKYFCRSLTGYFRNYVRDSKPKEVKKKYCSNCNNEIETTSNRKKYCEKCSIEANKELNKKRCKKYYNKIKLT